MHLCGWRPDAGGGQQSSIAPYAYQYVFARPKYNLIKSEQFHQISLSAIPRLHIPLQLETSHIMEAKDALTAVHCVFKIHPLGTLNICTKSNSCWDINDKSGD